MRSNDQLIPIIFMVSIYSKWIYRSVSRFFLVKDLYSMTRYITEHLLVETTLEKNPSLFCVEVNTYDVEVRNLENVQNYSN